MKYRSTIMAVVLAGLMCTYRWGQTTVSASSYADDDCEGQACLDATSKSRLPNPDARVYTPRTWQVNEAAQQQAAKNSSGKKRKQKNDRYDLQYVESSVRNADTEFQKYVLQATGIHLPIYGENFFLHSNDPSAKPRTAIPSDYTLAVGDQVLIHIWGQMDLNALVIVDRNGQILLPRIGVISIVGVRYDHLHDYLKNFLSRLFKRFDLSVSLGQLHAQKIYVTGSVNLPGYYIMPPLSTLVDALSGAGGPAKNGSMRHIQLRHEGQETVDVDLYDLLLNGGKSKDLLLQSGDTIYVPPAGPQVAVFGSVKRPAIYELRENATVANEIEQAGGLTASADRNRATLERIDEQLKRRIEAFALDDPGQGRILKDGDVLHVFAISPGMENVVTLRGNVAHPGRYPWHEGMRVRDLIPSPQFLITDEYWRQQNALGRNGSGWIEGAKPNKDGTAYSGFPQASSYSKELKDAVPAAEAVSTAASIENNKEGTEAAPKTEIKRNGAEINWEYAVVQRLNRFDLSSQLVSFNLGHAMRDYSSTDNLVLQDGDVITIFSQQDVKVPIEKRTKFVWIEGEVAAAGVYRVEPGESLRDLIARAGGLTPQAYLFAVDFRRESARVSQQEKLERLVDETEKELRSRAARIAASGNEEERKAAGQELESEKQVIEKLRQSRATGRIVLDLKSSDTDIDALPAIPLEDGDRIVVPPTPAIVEIVGAVYNQNSFLYRAGKNIADYLRQSGGGTRDADTQRMFVIRADGSVVSKQMHHGVWGGSFASLKLMPGDTIVMPERVRTGSLIREIRDWSQIFSQFALGAAAVRVIGP